MFVLFLNAKKRQGTPWLTPQLIDCSVASRVVVRVQWLAHPTSIQGDAGSIPTHGTCLYDFFIHKREQLVVRCRYFFIHFVCIYIYIYIYIYILCI